MYGLSRLTVYIGLAVLSISKFSIRGDKQKKKPSTWHMLNKKKRYAKELAVAAQQISILKD